MLSALGAEEGGALLPPVDTVARGDVASVDKAASVNDGAAAAVVEEASVDDGAAAAAVVEDASDPASQQPPEQHSSEDGQP